MLQLWLGALLFIISPVLAEQSCLLPVLEDLYRLDPGPTRETSLARSREIEFATHSERQRRVFHMALSKYFGALKSGDERGVESALLDLSQDLERINRNTLERYAKRVPASNLSHATKREKQSALLEQRVLEWGPRYAISAFTDPDGKLNPGLLKANSEDLQEILRDPKLNESLQRAVWSSEVESAIEAQKLELKAEMASTEAWLRGSRPAPSEASPSRGSVSQITKQLSIKDEEVEGEILKSKAKLKKHIEDVKKAEAKMSKVLMKEDLPWREIEGYYGELRKRERFMEEEAKRLEFLQKLDREINGWNPVWSRALSRASNGDMEAFFPMPDYFNKEQREQFDLAQKAWHPFVKQNADTNPITRRVMLDNRKKAAEKIDELLAFEGASQALEDALRVGARKNLVQAIVLPPDQDPGGLKKLDALEAHFQLFGQSYERLGDQIRLKPNYGPWANWVGRIEDDGGKVLIHPELLRSKNAGGLYTQGEIYLGARDFIRPGDMFGPSTVSFHEEVHFRRDWVGGKVGVFDDRFKAMGMMKQSVDSLSPVQAGLYHQFMVVHEVEAYYRQLRTRVARHLKNINGSLSSVQLKELHHYSQNLEGVTDQSIHLVSETLMFLQKPDILNNVDAVTQGKNVYLALRLKRGEKSLIYQPKGLRGMKPNRNHKLTKEEVRKLLEQTREELESLQKDLLQISKEASQISVYAKNPRKEDAANLGLLGKIYKVFRSSPVRGKK